MNDPAARIELMDRLGLGEYKEAFHQHTKESTVATVNGYAIHSKNSCFGCLYAIADTDRAFHGQSVQVSGTG